MSRQFSLVLASVLSAAVLVSGDSIGAVNAGALSDPIDLLAIDLGENSTGERDGMSRELRITVGIVITSIVTAAHLFSIAYFLYKRRFERSGDEEATSLQA